MEEHSHSTPWLRWILLFGGAIGAIIGIGIFYTRLVQPQEAVWDLENPVHWEKPMPLSINTDVERYRGALALAVQEVNRNVGCNLLIVAWNPTIEIIEGTIEVGEESRDWGAGSFVSRDISRGEIVIYRPLMVGTDVEVIMHEIGHLFGLAHDRHGAMRPIIEERIGGGVQVPRFTDKDSAALENRYCSAGER